MSEPTRALKRLLMMLKLAVVATSLITVVLLVMATIHRFQHSLQVKVLLTSTALFFGFLLMRVQIHAFAHRRDHSISRVFLLLGLSAILLSQTSFLLLVWSGRWYSWPGMWQTWWISMVPSVFLSHLMLIPPGGGWVSKLARVCVVWAGLMILYPGLRNDMLADLPLVYLLVASVPAVGTVVLSIYLAIMQLHSRIGSGQLSQRSWLTGLILSHLVIGAGTFYTGRATSGRNTPADIVSSVRSDMQEQLQRDKYDAQKLGCTWMGDTRISSREFFISEEKAGELARMLRPGDIILERRNWYFSNPFLPGFWPHSALYIGTEDELEQLGVTLTPQFLKHRDDYLSTDSCGYKKVIIEAVSEGVILTSAEHSMNADYVAVLRPNLSENQIAMAITRAFGHLGKEYDFNFDFDDTGRLVCSQVVYLAYLGMIDLELQQVMGRNTLPCIEFAKKFVAEREDPSRQLDFVLFCDGDAATGTARLVTELDFCQSIKRPRALVERRP